MQEPQATSQDVYRSENLCLGYQDMRLEKAKEALVVTSLVAVAVVDGRGRRGRSGNDRGALLANGSSGSLNGGRALGGEDEGGKLRSGGNGDSSAGRLGVAEATGRNGRRTTDGASLGQEARGSTSAGGKSAVTDRVRGRDISWDGSAVRGRGRLSRHVSRADVLTLGRDIGGRGRLASGDSDGLLLSDGDGGGRGTFASAASTSRRNNGTSTLNRDVLTSAVAVSGNGGGRGRSAGVDSDVLGGGRGRLKSGVGSSLVLAASRSSLGGNTLLGGGGSLVTLGEVDGLVDGLGGGGGDLGGHSVSRRASADGVDKSLGGDVDLLGDGSADSLNNSRGLVASAVTVARCGRSVGGSRGGSLRRRGGQLRLGADGSGERDGAGDQDGGRSRAVSDGLSTASRGEDLGGVDDRGNDLRAIVGETSRVGDASDGERREASADGGNAGHDTSTVAGSGESGQRGSLSGDIRGRSRGAGHTVASSRDGRRRQAASARESRHRCGTSAGERGQRSRRAAGSLNCHAGAGRQLGRHLGGLASGDRRRSRLLRSAVATTWNGDRGSRGRRAGGRSLNGAAGRLLRRSLGRRRGGLNDGAASGLLGGSLGGGGGSRCGRRRLLRSAVATAWDRDRRSRGRGAGSRSLNDSAAGRLLGGSLGRRRGGLNDGAASGLLGGGLGGRSSSGGRGRRLLGGAITVSRNGSGRGRSAGGLLRRSLSGGSRGVDNDAAGGGVVAVSWHGDRGSSRESRAAHDRDGGANVVAVAIVLAAGVAVTASLSSIGGSQSGEEGNSKLHHLDFVL